MRMNVEALEAEALKLSPADRTHLLERLILALDTDAAVESAWENVAELRQADIESGKVKLLSDVEVLGRLRARLDQ
ncbi:MAG TPA: addiction module protein [Fluviicoccus sp.]|nr:addiction module protein [Fluviicoccus sp.]